jgi:cyclopropane fatty-acyl-phospholipid synthase-like methyltransferase
MSNQDVKNSYNKIASRYAAQRDQFQSEKYLQEFIKHVPKGRTVLDVGCGPGKPVDDFLVKSGYAVNGIDISESMIEIAKQNVPQAFYEVKDMSELKDGEYCVDGIVSFYAIFHTPREKHLELLKKFITFMPNGGTLLITMGSSDWVGSEDFHGENMSWSHYDAEKNAELVKEAGFQIILNEIDTSGNERHQILLATCTSI